MQPAQRIMCGYTGTPVDPLDPSPQSLVIEDIAHALSAQPRFAGHTHSFLSVAQHSIWVSRHVPERLALAGLLHDAPRAYLMDLLGPYKRDIIEYTAAERRFQRATHAAFSLNDDVVGSRLIAAADDAALLVEWRDHKDPDLEWWGVDPALLSDFPQEDALSPADAEAAFLARFAELTQPASMHAGSRDDYRRLRGFITASRGWRPPVRPEIVTYSGHVLDPLRPEPMRIDAADIAKALSRMPRFAGHTRVPYSVAQHSVFVADYSDVGEAAYGLLHDASEAYLLDVPSPVKRVMPGYRLIEHTLQRAILESIGLDSSVIKPPSVARADELSLRCEQRDLMRDPHGLWTLSTPSLEQAPPVQPLGAEAAELLFLERFTEKIHDMRPRAFVLEDLQPEPVAP